VINEDRAKALHQDSIVALCHEDVPVDVAHRRMNGEREVLASVHLPRYRQGGVNLVVMAVGGDQIRPYCQPASGFPVCTFGALYGLNAVYDDVEESRGEFFIIDSVEGLDQLSPGGPVGLTLHLEGGQPLAGQLSMLKVFYRLGVRSLQFAWYGRNELADSTAEQRPGGLSRFGRDVVKAMNDLGMLIDLSHVAEPCFYDVLETSTQPVIASHSNAKALVSHHRNLTDDQIKAVADTGGLAGVVFYPKFVAETDPSIEDVLDHIDHMTSLAGVDHIAVGPDFVDYAPDLILGNVVSLGQAVEFKFPSGLESVTQMPNLTRGLLQRGYDEEAIKKILGENLLRVLRSVWR